MTSDAEITLGALPLLSPQSSGGDYEIDVCTDGTDYGNPAAVVADVASMLMDGDQAQILRYGNREAILQLRITGTSLDAVAAGTVAIEAEVNKGRNILTWLPPGQSTASVFDVVYSTLDFKHDDLAELRVTRYFTLTLFCLPFARRAELTTVVADPIPTASPTVTSIDDCTSTTNWSVVTGSGLATSGGAVTVDVATIFVGGFAGYVQRAELRRAALSTAFLATDYLIVEVETPATSVSVVSNLGPGVLRSTEGVSGNRRKLYYSLPAGTLTTVNLAVSHANLGAGVQFKVYDLSKTDQLPYAGTKRQRAFTLPVDGSARATASLKVEAGSGDGLGDSIMVYTFPTGAAMSPNMRPRLTSSGTVTSSSTSVSGSYSAGNHTFTLPASEVPSGAHLIIGRFRTTAFGTYTLSWTVDLEDPNGWGGGALLQQAGLVSAELDSGLWKTVALGVATLPPAEVSADSSRDIKIVLTQASAVLLDELWLFNLDTGVLSQRLVKMSGTAGDYSTSPQRLEIRSAELDSPQPSWVSGALGVTSEDVDTSLLMASPGVHDFTPGDMTVFVVTPGTLQQTITVAYFERFRHHVPPKDS